MPKIQTQQNFPEDGGRLIRSVQCIPECLSLSLLWAKCCPKALSMYARFHLLRSLLSVEDSLQGIFGFSQGAAMAALTAAVVSPNFACS